MTGRADPERWWAAAAAGATAIAAGLGPRGQWPGRAVVRLDPQRANPDMAAPLTAIGLLGLVGVSSDPFSHPEPVAEVVRRSREHLRATVRPGGMWRYYANIPVDTDDSAMCALALGAGDPLAAATAATLAGTIRSDGMIPTWLRPGWDPVIDTVPTANVLAVLGQSRKTDPAIRWLAAVVAAGAEERNSVFYLDPLDLHLAVSRAVQRGVGGLAEPLQVAAVRAAVRLADPTLSGYRLGQVAAVLLAARALTAPLARDLAERIMAAMGTDCTWGEDSMYVAGAVPRPGLVHYRSWAVSTALCVRALAASAAQVRDQR